MARLRKLEQLTNQIVPHYANVHLYPRGLPFYVDMMLSGSIRFARRTGPTLAVINPDTFHKITTKALRLTRTISVDRITSWLSVGSIISIGPGLEYNIIDDIVSETKQILTQFDLAADHGITEKVQLYATPLVASGPSSKGSSLLLIFSPHPILNGDKVTVLRNPSLLNSLLDLEVGLAELIGTSGYPGYPYSYRLTLKDKLPINVGTQDLVYLKATSAYISDIIDIPSNTLTMTALGPVLVDYISGMLRAEAPVSETLSLKTFDTSGEPVLGTGYSAVVVNKNHPVVDVSVPANVLLFWTHIAGTVQYEKGGKIFLIPNADGEFAVYTEVIPAMPSGSQWKVTVKASRDSLFRARFGKQNSYTDYNLLAGIDTEIVIGTQNTDQPVDEIEIVCKCTTGDTVIEMGDWITNGKTIKSVQFYLTAEPSDDAQWQASGMILKPYFLTIDYVRMRFDNNQTFNSGLLFL